MGRGIEQQRIAETPVAVIDFETTGLTPGYDRVVEVSVVRIDPGEAPRLLFDTLVNPCRPMAATEIHGIGDADVAHAPKFQEIAGEIIAATEGCAVAAYNVYFDIKFLDFELSNAGVNHQPPHFCLMYLRPMLGLGNRCKLAEACRYHGIDYDGTHVASDDAMAAGLLFGEYLREIESRGLQTFGELSALKSYKFNRSFRNSPFPAPAVLGLNPKGSAVSRAGFQILPDPRQQALTGYWDALKAVLADLEITPEELAYVKAEQQKSGLQPEEIRMLHARAFASVLSQFTADKWLDDREARKLQKLHQCLAELGWAPGM